MKRKVSFLRHQQTHGAVCWLASASILVAVGCSDDDSASRPDPSTSTSTATSSTLPTTTSSSTSTTSAPTGTIPSTTGSGTSTVTTDPSATATSEVLTETSASIDTTSSLDPASSDPSASSGVLTSGDVSTSEVSTSDVSTSDVEVPTLDSDAGVDPTSSETGETSSDVTEAPTSEPVSDVPDASVSDDSSEGDTTDVTSETTVETATSAGESTSSDETVAGPYGANLLTDSGFETGLGSWVGLGDGVVVDRSSTAYVGQYSASATNRGDGWHGMQTNITALVTPGVTYRVDGALQVSGAASAEVKLTVKFVCGTDSFMPVATGTASNTAWVALNGEFTVPTTCEQTQTVWFYAEGPGAGIGLLLDEVSLREVH